MADETTTANPPEQTATGNGGTASPFDGTQPFDMGGFAQEMGETQPEQYAQGDGMGGDDPAAGTGGTAPGQPVQTPTDETKRKTAKMLMMMVDRLQANAFGLFAPKGTEPDTFKMKETERNEASGYLAEGLPDHLRIPWWVFFLVVMGWSIIANVQKLRKLKEQARKQAEAERLLKQKEEEQRQRDEDAAAMGAAGRPAPRPHRATAAKAAKPAKAAKKAKRPTAADREKATADAAAAAMTQG